MVSFRDSHGVLRRPRLKNLQRAQEEIYRQLQLLMPEAVAHHDTFASRVDGSPELRLELLERHPYTHFVRLTYLFGDERRQRLAPDAHIRVYHDARIAEVTAFDSVQGFNRTAHPWYPVLPLVQRAWRENVALEKWLGYLLGQGHRFDTMTAVDSAIPTAEKTARVAAPA
ncbi:DUF1249 domain-containing protein [Marinihelvus fidelis]|uniref:DUF1249 domain-containing protein n=1 Tax=Marinihelvus fidelis TaxID=2613842 RepID=A0A5N0TEZ4_9GAMM|nr:DUF1249 domain-containing protein [Marinihelvus fidelis]KAA9133181.1 DUF1249 domain-containing protein [Marinihelvus fidelis]